MTHPSTTEPSWHQCWMQDPRPEGMPAQGGSDLATEQLASAPSQRPPGAGSHEVLPSDIKEEQPSLTSSKILSHQPQASCPATLTGQAW